MGHTGILILSQGVCDLMALGAVRPSVCLCVRDARGLPLPFVFALLLAVQLLGQKGSEPSEGGALPVLLPGRGPSFFTGFELLWPKPVCVSSCWGIIFL